jgi:hypothetical protein
MINILFPMSICFGKVVTICQLLSAGCLSMWCPPEFGEHRGRQATGGLGGQSVCQFQGRASDDGRASRDRNRTGFSKSINQNEQVQRRAGQ